MDWSQASCGKLSSAQAEKMFFLKRGGSPKRARLFCATCPIVQQCRDYAILYDEVGIWGGMTENDRDSISGWVKPMLMEKAIAEGTLEIRYDPATLEQQVELLEEECIPIFQSEAS